jgi:predicted anti-sigma-YlaC factor YlaD
MDCNRFEEDLTDYFDGRLTAQETGLFRAHALQCRPCRRLMDEVKANICVCKEQDEVEPSALLNVSLAGIPIEHPRLRCAEFEELITEFLDGFVPAQTYHSFEEHSENCEQCSTLLTGVVYAVAACHSVHTFEEVEVPASLITTAIAMMPARTKPRARRFADAVAVAAERLMPRTPQTARWTFGTAASLGLATFAFLLFGFSDDGTFGGVYRQAHVKASEIYTQGTDIYSETDKVVARVERVGRGIGEFWDTLGGETKQDSNARKPRKTDPNSNKETRPIEKN